MMTFCSETGDTSMTFEQCLHQSLQIAHYFRNRGYKQVGANTMDTGAMLTYEMQGDIVCLAMENRLDYCCYWLGLGMVGVTPALINNNLRQASLQHTITVVTSRAIIFSAETAPGGQGLSDNHKLGFGLVL